MMYISKEIQINIEQIFMIQEKYKKQLLEIEQKLKIDNNYFYKDYLYNIIKDETIKYESSIIRDYKIKKNKVGDYLQSLNDNIYNRIEDELKNQDFDITNFIRSLNKIIFPKGIWGETMNQSGQKYFKLYESGKFRVNQEFISLGGLSYYFVSFEDIDKALLNLNLILKDKKIFPTIKYLIYIFYFWNIHPFNDGNGAIARFLFPYFYIKEGFKIIAFDYKKFLINKDTNLFYTKDNINFDFVIKDFIDYIKK